MDVLERFFEIRHHAGSDQVAAHLLVAEQLAVLVALLKATDTPSPVQSPGPPAAPTKEWTVPLDPLPEINIAIPIQRWSELADRYGLGKSAG
jgi:hypothetical protein